MKYGLFTYKHSHNKLINIGDYVQSLAAKQFLPRVDEYVERDELNSLKGDEIKIIMNGWYTHYPGNWPPSDVLNPLFVSFHLNKSVSEEMMNNEAIVQYFKSKGPIGCRDYDSCEIMKKAGIDAYYSGCLTTTLNYKESIFETKPGRNNKIVLVDVLFKDDLRMRFKRNKLYILRDLLKGDIVNLKKVKKYIDALIPNEHKEEISTMTCYYNANTSESQRFEQATNILKELASAKIVVTSRIHIALPCLALGTPVLFVFGGQLTNLQEFRRLDGIIHLMNVLVEDDFDTSAEHLKGISFYRKNEVDWNNPPKNPDHYVAIRNSLIKKCESFIEIDA